ncbi:MAG: GerMN domain-containing protein [Clostridiales bacterium]|nr:GerMN domain-containing protein [Clostridiales bacterium]
MKKKFSILILLLTILSLSVNGCSTKKIDKEIDTTVENTTGIVETTTVEETEAALTVIDYYPFTENNSYLFEGEGNEYASYSVFIDYIDENRMQTRTNNGGSETVRIIEYKNGQLIETLSREETYFRENFLSNPPDSEEILLKEPLTIGTTWTLPDGRKRYISNIDMEISTPASDYLALEVTTEGDNYINYNYYVKNLGLVKTLFVSDGMEVTSTLETIEKNTPLIQTVNFYYPNINENTIEPTEKKLSFYTNDLTVNVFETAYKNFSKTNSAAVIGENVKINELYLDNNSTVQIDFSKELAEELANNSEYEALVLQCISDTLRVYYGVEEVNITVDGEAYP